MGSEQGRSVNELIADFKRARAREALASLSVNPERSSLVDELLEILDVASSDPALAHNLMRYVTPVEVMQLVVSEHPGISELGHELTFHLPAEFLAAMVESGNESLELASGAAILRALQEAPEADS